MKVYCNVCKREHVVSFLQDSFMDVKTYNLKCEVLACEGYLVFTATQEVKNVEPVQCSKVGSMNGVFSPISQKELHSMLPCSIIK